MYHPDKAQFKSKDGTEDRTVYVNHSVTTGALAN